MPSSQCRGWPWRKCPPPLEPPGRWARGGRAKGRVGSSVVDLGGEVVLHPDLADQLDLALEPVGVVLLTDETPFEQLTGAVVALLDGQGDAAVVALDGGDLDCEVEL